MIDPALYNNIAVLYTTLEKYDQALFYITKAQENLKYIKDPIINKATFDTLDFNRAYIYERSADYPRATHLYKEIISRNPSYFNAYLRIAFLALRNNDFLRAMNYSKSAKDHADDAHKNNPQAMIASIYLKQDKLKEAFQEFEKLSATAPHDKYSLISLGNIIYNYSTQMRH